jgi:ABC-type uncharacterized transport system permease subunit
MSTRESIIVNLLFTIQQITKNFGSYTLLFSLQLLYFQSPSVIIYSEKQIQIYLESLNRKHKILLFLCIYLHVFGSTCKLWRFLKCWDESGFKSSVESQSDCL